MPLKSASFPFCALGVGFFSLRAEEPKKTFSQRKGAKVLGLPHPNNHKFRIEHS